MLIFTFTVLNLLIGIGLIYFAILIFKLIKREIGLVAANIFLFLFFGNQNNNKINQDETIYYSTDPISMNHLDEQNRVMHEIKLENTPLTDFYLYVFASKDTVSKKFIITSTRLSERVYPLI